MVGQDCSVVSLLLVCMSCIMVAEWCLVAGAKILKRHCKGFIKGFIEYTSTRKGKIVKGLYRIIKGRIQ
jgi:hypothetical protein